MSLVLGDNYPTELRGALERAGVKCKTPYEAQKEDIRELRVGILNIMPQAEIYEFNLLYPLGRSVLQVIPVLIKLKDHKYSSTDQEHLDKHYVYLDQATAEKSLDGLIITGAPVENLPFEEVKYWDELNQIMGYAHDNIISTFGLCWGGLAMAKYLGIEKTEFKKKLFGVFSTKNLATDHEIMRRIDDRFYCPQSRHSGIEDSVLERESAEGRIILLAHSEEVGYTIFETSDRKFLVHLGHLEYPSKRLVEEYNRDVNQGRIDVDPPKNVNLQNPENIWRANRQVFFSGWIKFIHERMQNGTKHTPFVYVPQK